MWWMPSNFIPTSLYASLDTLAVQAVNRDRPRAARNDEGPLVRSSLRARRVAHPALRTREARSLPRRARRLPPAEARASLRRGGGRGRVRRSGAARPAGGDP